MTNPTDWLSVMQNLPHWGEWAGGLLILAGLWQFIAWPSIKLLRSLNQTSHSFTKALPVLLSIADQFRPNGGGSLKDAVDRIENQLSLTNQRSRAICSYLDVALFEADPQGNYTFVSKDWCELVGLSQDEALGAGWINAVQAEHRDMVMNAWRRAVEERREFALEYDIYIPGGHGKTVRVSNRAFPSKRGSGKYEVVVGIVGILRRTEPSHGAPKCGASCLYAQPSPQ